MLIIKNIFIESVTILTKYNSGSQTRIIYTLERRAVITVISKTKEFYKSLPLF